MVSDVDTAWLAGIVDGEGCFSVKRPIRRKSGKRVGSVTSYQLWMVICNTSKPMVDRVAQVFAALGVHHQPVRRVWKGKRATRWQYWIHVARKRDMLRLTRALLPYLTAKKAEAEVVDWYLSRSCRVPVYKTHSDEAAVLDSMSVIKRNGGESTPATRRLLAKTKARGE